MMLAWFNPSARALIAAESDEERELLLRFRVGDPAAQNQILKNVKNASDQPQEGFRVSFTIEHQDRGDVWVDLPDLVRDWHGPVENLWSCNCWDVVRVIRDMADDSLGIFLSEHRIPIRTDPIYETTITNDETPQERTPHERQLLCYVRCGRYRVRVSGLPLWVEREWTRGYYLIVARPALFEVEHAIDDYIARAAKRHDDDISQPSIAHLLDLQRQVHVLTLSEYPPARAEIQSRLKQAQSGEKGASVPKPPRRRRPQPVLTPAAAPRSTSDPDSAAALSPPSQLGPLDRAAIELGYGRRDDGGAP
jgi:hypothetical protein